MVKGCEKVTPESLIPIEYYDPHFVAKWGLVAFLANSWENALDPGPKDHYIIRLQWQHVRK